MARRIFLILFSALLLLPVLAISARRGWLGSSAARWIQLQEGALRFNWIYSGNETPFRKAPNEFLVQAVADLKPGLALDVAMGQGRNALYLASRGWKVTGFDIAGSGLRSAREQAFAAHVNIRTVQATVEDFDYGREQWDLIVLIYVPIRYGDPKIVNRLRDALKPGGWVVAESPVEGSPAPGDLRPGQLRSLFDDLRILYYDESTGVTEWFPRETIVARMIAEKPETP